MTNPVTNTITQMQNETSISTRNVSGEMGKLDFLKLLSAQLRYQNPLEPMSDADFAAQLAQFSTLEQMQNMNDTLTAMSAFQAYSLIGKYVVAKATVDGELSEIPGVVDCIFTENGVTFAQIGEYAVPVSAITEVYDSSVMLTPKMLLEASNNLIGRVVKGSADGKEVWGQVTRVIVEEGALFAFLDDGSGEEKKIRVETIFDVAAKTGATSEKDAIKTESDTDNDGLKTDSDDGFEEEETINGETVGDIETP